MTEASRVQLANSPIPMRDALRIGDRVRGRGQQWFDGRTGRIVQEAPQFYFSRLVAFDDGGSSWMADSELVAAADSPRRSLSEAETLIDAFGAAVVRHLHSHIDDCADEYERLKAARAALMAALTSSSSSSQASI